jgi:integrase
LDRASVYETEGHRFESCQARSERNFYRDIWKPTQQASGLDIRPHECRHSYVTHLRAAGINDADLAEIAGHRVETMLARYTHAMGTSFEKVRFAIS